MPSKHLWALTSILLSLQGHTMNKEMKHLCLVGQFSRLDLKISNGLWYMYVNSWSILSGCRSSCWKGNRTISKYCAHKNSYNRTRSLTNISFKHGAILYKEAEVFSLSITIPNGESMLPFDWLIYSGLILARSSCREI